MVLRNGLRHFRFRLRGYHPLWPDFPDRFAYLIVDRVMAALQPRSTEVERFGLFPVRSPLLGEYRLISLPPGTEMFHFPGFASYDYVFTVR